MTTTPDSSLRPVSAWGRLSAEPHRVRRIASPADFPGLLRSAGGSALATGMHRSYGDVSLNPGGLLLDLRGLDRFIDADWIAGVVKVQAGLTIDDLLRVCVPKGWFIPVTPGTKFVTLGGAIANDVHGKNHHQMGTLGRSVRSIVLARSGGEVVEVSAEQRPELFAATIGGLGLTGVIISLQLSLVRIASAFIDVETIPVANVEDFFRINTESQPWPYTVAWVDCFAAGEEVGRGLYMRGRPAPDGGLSVHGRPRLAVPFTAPSLLLNSLTMQGFNAVYRRYSSRAKPTRMHYDGYFYPLDSIGSWNRLYGPRGFYQFQCAVPMARGPEVLRQMLSAAATARQGSFLIVLKTFGDLPSPGVLSFPLPGVTLALDFPNKGDSTRRLLEQLNAMAVEAGGRIYPAKDATMTAEQFQTSYPRWREVEAQRDPAISSAFWRRVTGFAA